MIRKPFRRHKPPGPSRASRAYGNLADWTRMSILNVAGMGRFSIDRTVRESATEIWRAETVPVPIPEG